MKHPVHFKWDQSFKHPVLYADAFCNTWFDNVDKKSTEFSMLSRTIEIS